MSGAPGAVGLPLARSVGWLLRVNRRLAGEGRRFQLRRRVRPRVPRRLRPTARRLPRDPLGERRHSGGHGDPPPLRATARSADRLAPVGHRVPVPGVRPATARRGAGGGGGRPPGRAARSVPTAGDPGPGRWWNDLTRIVATRPGMYLYPRHLWKSLSEHLLRELVIAEGGGLATAPGGAFSRLLEHPVAAESRRRAGGTARPRRSPPAPGMPTRSATSSSRAGTERSTCGENGDGTFAAGVKIGAGWQMHNLVFPVRNFDGDGYTDLMARRARRGAGVTRATAPGASAASGWSAAGGTSSRPSSAPPTSTATAGATCSPAPSRASCTSTRQRRRRVAAAPPRRLEGWEAFTAVTSPGDFDGDGGADVLARTSSGLLYLYPGTAPEGPRPR